MGIQHLLVCWTGMKVFQFNFLSITLLFQKLFK